MNVLENIQNALAAILPVSTPAETRPAEEEGGETPARIPGCTLVDPLRHGSHLDVLCLPEQVVDVARIMDAQGFFLESISGVDWLDRQEIEVIYDFSRLGGEHCRVMVHLCLPRSEPVVPTICTVFPSADWHERETYDFYGVHFQGHPNLIRILLPEDADFYPLRKDFMP